MPAVFGTMSGPRQVSAGGPVYDQARSPLRSVAYALFEADGAALAQMLPAGFALWGTPRLAVEFAALREIDWLGGRGYHMLMLRIPVVFTHRGTELQGWFQPVCWEDMAEPILSGREELGWSKVYGELPVLAQSAEQLVVAGEWEGFRFCELRLSGSAPAPAASYITMTPAGGSSMRLLSHQAATGAELVFHRPRWQDMPTQHQIVEPFAALALGRLLQAGRFEARGGKDLSDQLRLD
jgi:hypothetical protein